MSFHDAATPEDLPDYALVREVRGLDLATTDTGDAVMTRTVKDSALVVADDADVAESQSQPLTGMFERLARDPAVDVDKLERLMQMYERQAARVGKERFNAAMSAAQKAMRPIAADAENPQTRSKYASYGQLDRALRPIYTDHGFGVSYDTADCPLPDHVRVLAYVTHAGGHDHTYHLDMPNDGKGAKGGDVMTKTHATGAAMSYGMRYLLKMIFNVAVGEEDTDGNAPTQHPPAPTGFDGWLIDLEASADNGLQALSEAWKASKPEYREYLKVVDAPAIHRLKVRAQKVSA